MFRVAIVASNYKFSFKMKKYLISLLASTSLFSSSFGAVFALNNIVNEDTTDWLLQNPDGSLADGGIVSIGYFTGGLSSPSLSSISSIIAGYTTVHSVTSGSSFDILGPGVHPGYFESSVYDAGTITSPSTLISLPIYLFAGNNSTLATSTAFALLQVGTIADDQPFPQTYVAGLDGGVLVANIGVEGSYTGPTVVTTGTFTTIQLAAIPEPSSAMLGALGALALLRRRRAVQA
jgi:hypothetical protein